MITAHEAQQLSRSSEIQTTKELEKIEILIKTEAATGKTILFYNCPKLEAEKVLQLKRLSAMAIRKIPKAEAMKIKDREGFVEVIGFGKIHINNWK